MRSLTWRFETSKCCILAAWMPGRQDLTVHSSTDSMTGWASTKLSTGWDPWTKADWVQQSKAPAEMVNETWAACFVLGQRLPWENPHSLRPVHHPMVQTAVNCGQGTVSLEWMSVPQLCISGVTVCCSNSYKRKTVPFFNFNFSLACVAPDPPGRRSALSKMFLTSHLTSPKFKV